MSFIVKNINDLHIYKVTVLLSLQAANLEHIVQIPSDTYLNLVDYMLSNIDISSTPEASTESEIPNILCILHTYLLSVVVDILSAMVQFKDSKKCISSYLLGAKTLSYPIGSVTAAHHLFLRACISNKMYQYAVSKLAELNVNAVNSFTTSLDCLLYCYYAGIW